MRPNRGPQVVLHMMRNLLRDVSFGRRLDRQGSGHADDKGNTPSGFGGGSSLHAGERGRAECLGWGGGEELRRGPGRQLGHGEKSGFDVKRDGKILKGVSISWFIFFTKHLVYGQ